MASEEAVPRTELKLRRLAAWFDTESAAVVTILLGLFQVMLSPSFAYSTQNPSKLFVLTILIGILIVAGGSITMANERNPNKLLLQSCACSNVVALLVALLAFCLYCYSLSSLPDEMVCLPSSDDMYYYRRSYTHCPPEMLKSYSWSLTLLLMIFDMGAAAMLGILSVSALRTLKTE